MRDHLTRLLLHGGGLVNEGDDDVPTFVGMLRPYRGLDVRAYADMMDALFEEIRHMDMTGECRRAAMAATACIWRVVHNLVFRDGAPLTANRLLSPEDRTTIGRWVSAFSKGLEGGLHIGFNGVIGSLHFENLADSREVFPLGGATETLLIKGIDADDPDVQLPAIAVAGRFSVSTAIPALTRAVSSPTVEVRAAAASAMAQLRQKGLA